MTKIADDAESISRRLKELEAERNEAMTGSSAPVTGQEEKAEEYPVYGYSLGSMAHPNWPYAGTGFEWRKFVRSS